MRTENTPITPSASNNPDNNVPNNNEDEFDPRDAEIAELKARLAEKDAGKEAPKPINRKPDETVSGGVYIVDGIKVNSEGKAIK